ncbi:MAG: acyl-CoA dehydrogenase family protein, partial [Pseudomonadota bacterium]
MDPLEPYDAARLRPEVAELLRLAHRLGRENFAPRAARHDLEASFPTENYADLAKHGFLRLVVPEADGGLGFSVGEYALIGAEIGRHCGATALTFNMHTSSILWARYMSEMPNLSAADRA